MQNDPRETAGQVSQEKIFKETKNGYFKCEKGSNALYLSFYDRFGWLYGHGIEIKEGRLIFWGANKRCGIVIYKDTDDKEFIEKVENLMRDMNNDFANCEKIINFVKSFFKLEGDE